MKRDKITVNDRQLACARITSQEGQDYLKGMAAAGNYAWVNRASMTFLTRQVNLLTTQLNAELSDRSLTARHYGCFLGLLQSVHDDAGRPGHARHLRRVPQHRQGGGAHGGRQAEDAAASPQRLHASFPPPPPPDPRGLPGTSPRPEGTHASPLNVGSRILTISSSILSAHRSARADWRNHGNLQLRPNGNGARHDGNLRHHLPRSGTSPRTPSGICVQ